MGTVSSSSHTGAAPFSTGEGISRHRLRLFAWLGIASLLIPWVLDIETISNAYSSVYTIDAYWAPVGVWASSSGGRGFVFALFGFGFSGIHDAKIIATVTTLLVVLALLVAGCLLLFKGRRLGSAAFLAASLLDVAAIYLYPVLFSPPVPVGVLPDPSGVHIYTLPVGIVLSAIIGVGALALTRRSGEKRDRT